MLRLYEKLACWRCVGLMYRCQQADKTGRIERLRKLLGSPAARLKPRVGRTLDRRKCLEVSLKRALIVERRKALRGADKVCEDVRQDPD
jgi:hypothetical protein